MSNQFMRLLLIIVLAGWQAAWAESVTAPNTPAAIAADAEDALRQMQVAPPRGLLYEVSKNGHTGYLFGTIHVGRADFFPLDLVATQAMAKSGELVVELDASQTGKMQAGLQRYALLPAPRPSTACFRPNSSSVCTPNSTRWRSRARPYKAGSPGW
jgi:hypothetical protein